MHSSPSAETLRVGPYRLVAEIGRGGMGVVHRAVRDDAAFEREVALKLVRPGIASPAVLARFRAERQILARLEHPNIAALFDGGTTADGQPYLVMELVAGLPLVAYCKEHGTSLRARLALFRVVCEAVHYLHQNLVVHRDLKPANILVTVEGVPKILDFGIAKLLAEAPEDAPATATLMPGMTPEYASPEQVTGRPITTASDVYSLGVVLYELLTGRKPYEIASRSPEEVLRAVCHTEPRKPSAVGGRELEGDLDTIVQRALHKEPERRYRSAHELAEDLRRHLHGKPVLARGDAFGYRLGRFVRAHRSLALGAPLLLATLGLGFVAAARQARIAEANRLRAEKRFEDTRRLANALVFEVHEQIEALPGATAARGLLLNRASAHLDALAVDAPGNPELAEELATAYQMLADVQGLPGAANLGDPQAALLSQRKALALRQRLAEQRPDDLARQDRLAGSLISQSYAERDGASALRFAHQARTLADRLARLAPGEAKARRRLATAHYAVAAHLADDGDLPGAAASYQEAASLFEALHGADPTSAGAQRDLALTEKRLAGILSAQGDAKGALARSRRAVQLDEAVMAARPGSAGAARDLSVSLVDLGEGLLSTGDPAAAIPVFRRAVEIRERLRVADAKNDLARRDLVSALTRLGGAQTDVFDLAGARRSLDAVGALLPADAALDGSGARHAEAMARLHEAAGRPNDALASWRRALDFRSAQIADAGGAYAWLARVDFVETSLGLGRALEDLARRTRSSSARAEVFREAAKVYDEGLRMALALESEKRLAGRNALLVSEVRQSRTRIEAALLPPAAPQLTPARPSP